MKLKQITSANRSNRFGPAKTSKFFTAIIVINGTKSIFSKTKLSENKILGITITIIILILFLFNFL